MGQEYVLVYEFAVKEDDSETEIIIVAAPDARKAQATIAMAMENARILEVTDRVLVPAGDLGDNVLRWTSDDGVIYNKD